MHTPEGFTPSHSPPATLPEETLAFAFRDDKLLVGGPEDAPLVPQSSMLESLGVDGDRHYLGELAGVAGREALGRVHAGRARAGGEASAALTPP